MTEPILELKNVSTVVRSGIKILDSINLKINEGDFLSIIGTNGAGKSTLFNVISGQLPISSGQIMHHGEDITKLSEEEHPKFLSRVFQDPKQGTAPRMTVAENLLLATKRGESRFLKPRHLKSQMGKFKKLAQTMHNGLEDRLDTATGDLSGGQRQALSFLMAVIKRPDVLLLDEHTAALDRQTSEKLMNATDEHISEDHLTALMITHQLEDALKYGNRLLVLNRGQIKADLSGSDKENLTVEQLYNYLG